MQRMTSDESAQCLAYTQQINSNRDVNLSRCPLRQFVKAHCYGTSSNGFRCGCTGSRCMPSEHCVDRLKGF